MTLFHLMILALVQGITEFLPISSSGHLILIHQFGGPSGDDIALDVAVHLGSILAVILYFRTDVARAFGGIVPLARGDMRSPDARLALGLVIATIPAVLVGGLMAVTGWVDALRDIRVIGWTMILFGILLYVVHARAPEARSDKTFSLRDAVVMGLWQAVSLIPGVSRSGITMTAARWLGFERHSAAKIALLMSIPITLCTGALLAVKLGDAQVSPTLWRDAGLAAVMAFGAAYAALVLMIRFLDRVSFTPYVVYRVILGVVLLAIAYS